MTDRWTDDPHVQDDPDLHALLSRLSTTVPTEVSPARRQDTLQAMLATAARRPAPPSTWQRRTRRVLALGGAKVVLVAGVATAGTTSGLAATGNLPDPVQSFVHEVAGDLGIGVPDAPGQRMKAGEGPANELAPGQLKRDEGSRDARELAPGQNRDAVAPGRSGDAPGQVGDAPGDTDPKDRQVGPPAAPGTSADAPGHTGDTGTPDETGPPPGTTSDPATGAGDDPAPDPADDGPGRSGSAPGRAGDRPGGQAEDAETTTEDAPANPRGADLAPGRVKDEGARTVDERD